MFRSAFPTSSQDAEDQEMIYVASKFDTVTAGRENDANGRLTGKVSLANTQRGAP